MSIEVFIGRLEVAKRTFAEPRGLGPSLGDGAAVCRPGHVDDHRTAALEGGDIEERPEENGLRLVPSEVEPDFLSG